MKNRGLTPLFFLQVIEIFPLNHFLVWSKLWSKLNSCDMQNRYNPLFIMVARVGFEPTTFGL